MSAKPLPPVPGMNVVQNNGLYTYSRYPQNELDQRSQSYSQNGPVPTPEPKTVDKQSNDQFKASREEAISTGRFDYGAVKSSFYTPPNSYVNDQGVTVSRESSPPPLTEAQKQTKEQERQQSQQRRDEDKAYNERLIAFRGNAPSSIKSGSAQDIAVRQLAAQQEEQLYQAGNFKQSASSNDSQAKVSGLVSNDVHDKQVSKPMPKPEILPVDLTGGIPREARETYQYAKNQVTEPLKLSPNSQDDLTGLVGITSIIETKNGVTTTTTTVPQVVPTTLREKLAEAEGSLQVKNMGGEAVSFLKVPFSGEKATNPNEPLVRSTSLADPLSLLPGLGGGVIETGTNILIKGASKIAGRNIEQITSKVVSAFKENPLEVRTEKVGETSHLTQGTEQEITLTNLKPEKIPITRPMDIGNGKTVEVRAGYTILPKGISETKQIEGIGKVGEKTVPHEPTNQEIANRYPLYGKGNNDLSDLTNNELPKTIPQTETKPVFGKVVKEVPNLIDVTAQSEKSGQSILSEAFVSKNQVAFVREPSQLAENKILVVGKPSEELISTFGLKKIKGTENQFISPELTKGMKEYLTNAEKAGLITTKLQETHIQSAKDVLSNPKLYAQASREPELYEKFPEITRPQVIGQREVYPMKTQILKKSTDELRSFKKMQPFGPIKESKGGAGSAGKAKAILEAKTESRPIKSELFRTEKPVRTGLEPSLVKSSPNLIFETVAYPKGTSNKLLQSFQIKEDILSKTNSKFIVTEKVESGQKARTMTENGLLEKNIQDVLTSSKQSDKTLSSLINKNEEITTQKTTRITNQATDQITGLTTKQTTTQITTITNTPPPTTTKTITGPPPGLSLKEEKKIIQQKLKRRSNKEVNFLGNAQTSNVVGLYSRSEITLGNKKTARLLAKDQRTSKNNSFKPYSDINKYKPTKTSAKPFSKTKQNIFLNRTKPKQSKKPRF